MEHTFSWFVMVYTMDTFSMTTAVAEFHNNSVSYFDNTTATIINESKYIEARYGNMQEFFYTVRPIIYFAERFIAPLWFLVGFPGNALAFMIWIQPRMRPSSGVYLTALAMTDFVFLILQLIFQLQNTYNISLLYYPVLCELFPVIFLAAQYLNPLLVLGFTVERYIAICHPFNRDKYCSTSRAVKVVIFLVVTSLLLHSIQGYFWHYVDGTCEVRHSVYAAGSASLWSVWSWCTELLVFGVVPVTILVLNIRVIVVARTIKKSEKKMLCLLKGQKLHQRKSGASATTFMLLAVSFYMIFTTLPVTMLYVLSPLFPLPETYMWDHEIQADLQWQRYLNFFSVRTVIERVCISHYACNFYIYLATGHVFRQELQTMFIKTFCKGMSHRIRNSELDDLLSTYTKKETPSQNGQNGAVAHL